MSKSFLVAGAGIAGLATAVALQREGHSVSVIEERTDTSAGSGISIWPNALAALDHISLGNAVRDAGHQVVAGSVRWHDGRFLQQPNPDSMTRALGEPLVVINRSDLMNLLTEALAPGTIETGVAVLEVVSTLDGVQVRCSDGRTRHAAGLVGADGTRSVVARWLNGPLPDRYAGYTAWRGVADVGIDSALAGQTLGPGAEVGHVPLGPERTYWFATGRTAEGQRSPEGEKLHVQARFSQWPDPILELIERSDQSHILRNDIYDRATARHWSRGPTVIVGDAAHPMRPHLGQGGCQGLEDAAILAALMKRDHDVPAAFAHFEAVRKRRVSSIVRQSRRTGQILNMQPPWLGAAVAQASALIPEAALMRNLACVASRDAFVIP